MSDYSELERRAQAAISFDDVSVAPDVLLELIADLKRNQRMLLAACMDMGAIGNALGADMNSDGEELLSMVVELKAEVSGLKTGYEAYERVNAELKAEVEALRNALSDLLDLYDDDEGCRNLPQYIACRAAMGKGDRP